MSNQCHTIDRRSYDTLMEIDLKKDNGVTTFLCQANTLNYVEQMDDQIVTPICFGMDYCVC
jgi:hypothetical protein